MENKNIDPVLTQLIFQEGYVLNRVNNTYYNNTCYEENKAEGWREALGVRMVGFSAV